jgi:hypothetical protein
MGMSKAKVTQTNSGYEPTAVQQQRLASRKRFNWLVLYTPLILAAIIIFTVIGLLLWGALSPHIVGTREFASGVADIIIIATTIPMVLLCLLPPLGMVGLVVYRRQKREEGVKYGRLQTLFWRIDKLLTTIHNKTDETLPKVAKPVMQMNGFFAFISTFIQQIKRLMTRE